MDQKDFFFYFMDDSALSMRLDYMPSSGPLHPEFSYDLQNADMYIRKLL